MSTVCIVAVKSGDEYKAITVVRGRYNYVYKTLTAWYNTQERAEALVNHGDAIYIAERLEPTDYNNHSYDFPEENVCLFFCRDCGDFWNEAKPNVHSREELMDVCWCPVYIFEDGEWRVYNKD